jgi:SAM-dependent methyltransferase
MQTPVHVFTAAVLCGLTPPPIDRPFRFLDLACGNGLTLCLVADAYKHAEFVGIDINPDHVARASRTAAAAGLTNVSFHVGDILTVSAAEHGNFNYCAVSGVYSWLDAARRIAVRKFLNEAMLPGGLLYLDYSTQPGTAQSAALYRILQELAKNLEGTSADRLAGAARLADGMRQSGALFFKANPIASDRLDTILKNPAEDEAHEVLNLQEGGFWSADVIRDLAGAEFDFVGHSGFHHNLKTLSARPGSLDSIAAFSIASRQSLFDADWNIPHRRDIYVRQNGQMTSDAFVDALKDQYVFAVRDMLSEAQRRKLGANFRGYDFCNQSANRFSEIALTSKTFGDLFAGLAEVGMSYTDSIEITRHFLAIRLISVAVALPGAIDASGDLRMGSALNQNILTEDIGARHARPFSSPFAGTRVLLPLKDRLYLWAIVGLNLTDAWDRLGDLRGMFRDNNNKQVDGAAFVDIINQNLPGFRAHAAPELLRMGILVPS